MASGAEKSGLSLWFSEFLENVMPRQRFWSLLIVIIFGGIGTEVSLCKISRLVFICLIFFISKFISNLSMVSILLPILDKLALSYDIDYHFLVIPVAIAVNFSYAFPAAGKENK